MRTYYVYYRILRESVRFKVTMNAYSPDNFEPFKIVAGRNKKEVLARIVNMGVLHDSMSEREL